MSAHKGELIAPGAILRHVCHVFVPVLAQKRGKVHLVLVHVPCAQQAPIISLSHSLPFCPVYEYATTCQL